MPTPRKWIAPLAAALLVSFVTGCIQFPTAPVVSRVSGQSTGGVSIGRDVKSTGLIGGLDSLVTGLDQMVFNTLDLVGSVGGTLTNDRWKVVVPPNAVSGDVTISLGVLSATSPMCELEITPLSANHFAVPVLLTVDCSSVPANRLKYYSIFWYDPSIGKWVPVEGSSVDLQSKTVTAPLQHFSKYSVQPTDGRAGW